MNFWSSEGLGQRAQSKIRFSFVESRYGLMESTPLCLHIWLSRDKSHDYDTYMSLVILKGVLTVHVEPGYEYESVENVGMAGTERVEDYKESE